MTMQENLPFLIGSARWEWRITEYESHEELMAKEGRYVWLYNMQAERYR